jgi:hypothetical protein
MDLDIKRAGSKLFLNPVTTGQTGNAKMSFVSEKGRNRANYFVPLLQCRLMVYKRHHQFTTNSACSAPAALMLFKMSIMSCGATPSAFRPATTSDRFALLFTSASPVPGAF